MRGCEQSHQLVGAAQQHGDGLAGVGDAGDLGDLAALQLHLLDQVRVTQLVLCEGVHVRHRPATQRLCERERKRLRGR